MVFRRLYNRKSQQVAVYWVLSSTIPISTTHLTGKQYAKGLSNNNLLVLKLEGSTSDIHIYTDSF